MNAGARPRRGAPPKGEVSARERILATAGELFYREGIRAIGVDTVVERSGVSKTSLYRLFDSKDALIAAFVLRFEFLKLTPETPNPAEKVLQ